ncbi:YraN family protein [Candidatus Persebacteraceae bacterium Df01]|jgi:putative endonuclease|uniref:UPF0102 protein NQX30_01270 n=1 Tax=Candidatus Doriopsillibacter californiensis TaxID=2970740 RepID=A0ABT7QK17_9GAMM|nr:YraN family protein [Candidatus Persebacteraceae bacterium Df01]
MNTAGQLAEQMAVAHLKKHGLQVATTNYRCRRGEIDIIAEDGRTLVFVEVRQRKNLVAAAESIDYHKQRRLTAAATHYLAANGEPPCRFDAVLVDVDGNVRWLRNAFDATN